MKNKKGFTLVELLAVIVILGILLLIAVPAVQNIIQSSRKKAFESAAKLALENVEAVASIETTTANGATISPCYINIGDISLERGDFGTNKSGRVEVDANGKATIYIKNDNYMIDGKKLSDRDFTAVAAGTLTTLTSGLTACTWFTN